MEQKRRSGMEWKEREEKEKRGGVGDDGEPSTAATQPRKPLSVPPPPSPPADLLSRCYSNPQAVREGSWHDFNHRTDKDKRHTIKTLTFD